MEKVGSIEAEALVPCRAFMWLELGSLPVEEFSQAFDVHEADAEAFQFGH